VAQREYQRFGVPRLRPGKSGPIASDQTRGIGEIKRDVARYRNRSRSAVEQLAASAAGQWTSTIGEQFQRRGFDFVCALAGIAFLAPLFAMIALAIKLDDGGPVFYSQLRIGKGLRKFRLIKFRSMLFNCPGGSPLTAPQDVRVTRVGRFLRKYKLDELPQLLNVLKGEMQLVGVRPQVEKYVERFPKEYEELLQTPPGITDLASLSFRNEERLFQGKSFEERYITIILPIKLELALKYSRTRTFLSDIEILFRTVLGFQSPSLAWEETSFDPVLHPISRFNARKSYRALLTKSR
jgi:lipopolysaccharide/colanic/teichoic acid biosynthesis glycosyltransferase